MNDKEFQILSELEKIRPSTAVFDLTDEQTVTILRSLRAGGHIRLYMDGSAEITAAGRTALAAEQSRQEQEAMQAAGEAERIAGMRLIDADALKMKLASLINVAKSEQQKALLGRTIFVLSNMPTIDAEPVRHGRWEKLSAKEWPWEFKCTACGKPADGRTPYCPQCGARMDGDDPSGAARQLPLAGEP